MKPDQVIDVLEAEALDKYPLVEYKTEHRFFPVASGFTLYERTALLPKGTFITSLVHMVEHPFNVSEGKFVVLDNSGEKQLIKAPFRGTTLPNTRRALLILEDTIFTTYHVVPEGLEPEEIIQQITAGNDNPLISGRDKVALSQIRKELSASAGN